MPTGHGTESHLAFTQGFAACVMGKAHLRYIEQGKQGDCVMNRIYHLPTFIVSIIILFIVLLLVLWSAYVFWDNIQIRRNWIYTKARLLGAEFERYSDSKKAFVWLQLEYTANGRMISTWIKANEFNEELLLQDSKTGSVGLYCNPDDIKQAYYKYALPSFEATLIAAIIFGVIGTLLLLNGLGKFAPEAIEITYTRLTGTKNIVLASIPGLCLLLFGVLALTIGFRDQLKINHLRSVCTEPAESIVVSTESESGKRKVTFRFNVDGQNFETGIVTNEGNTKKYHVGQIIDLRYNPENLEEFYPVTITRDGRVLVIVFSLFLVAIGLAGLGRVVYLVIR
jgi:hypothetical protein